MIHDPQGSIRHGRTEVAPEWRSGYTWTCSMCRGIGLVSDLDDSTKVVDCPKCSEARKTGRAFEMVKRNIAPSIGYERCASPATRSQTIYEVWEFIPALRAARPVYVSDDIGETYRMKWELEEAAREGVR